LFEESADGVVGGEQSLHARSLLGIRGIGGQVLGPSGRIGNTQRGLEQVAVGRHGKPSRFSQIA
jgi:hypothetical protein